MNDRFVSINIMTSENPRGEDMIISVDQAIETYPEIAEFLTNPNLYRLGVAYEGVAIDVRLIDPDESIIWESLMPGVWKVSKNELASS